MGAVVSLGGCTASFVSPDGLIVTNHHCAAGALQFNSTPQRNLLLDGFLAKTREEELPNGPGSRVFCHDLGGRCHRRPSGRHSPEGDRP